MPALQSAQSHAAYDTITHLVLVPIFLINFGLAIYLLAHTWPSDIGPHLWWIVLSAAFLLIPVKMRGYSLRIQDRIIRLEERLRLATLVPAAELPRTAALTQSQLIALRFASDAELPSLALRAATENLPSKQIKEAITTWRPDHARI